MTSEPREITPVVFYGKGDMPSPEKDFSIRPIPEDLREVGDEDPKDSSATESAPSSEQALLETEDSPAGAEKDPESRTTEPSKPTSSSAPTISNGSAKQPVSAKIPSSSSPSEVKLPGATKPSGSASAAPSEPSAKSTD